MIEDFFKYQAQTSPHPLAMEISHAKGIFTTQTAMPIWIWLLEFQQTH